MRYSRVVCFYACPLQLQGTRRVLRTDDAVGRTQAERRHLGVFGQSRAGAVLPRYAAQHPRDRGHAHGRTHHQDRGLPELRGHRHSAGQQHEGVQAPGAEAVQRERHHLHQRVRIHTRAYIILIVL